MTLNLRSRVRKRARERCEYCLIPLRHDALPGQLDHVIATQHRGQTRYANLALACGHCNSHKGPNVGGIDPATESLVPLFNPRAQRWAQHFRYEGAQLIGLTASGRATIIVLAMNHPRRVSLRQDLIDAELFWE
jgi:hypothetical protein